MKPNLENYYKMRKENSKNTQMLEKTVIQLGTKNGEKKNRDGTEVVRQTKESNRSRTRMERSRRELKVKTNVQNQRIFHLSVWYLWEIMEYIVSHRVHIAFLGAYTIVVYTPDRVQRFKEEGIEWSFTDFLHGEKEWPNVELFHPTFSPDSACKQDSNVPGWC